uniref:ATP synthase subunit a n=1 Tax=Falcidens halanychi TaxID=370642 RepID=A0A343X872_9MOLL|nr:ATP synthase F0 subunit 6 [Falcidens halanychi]AWH02131.1 ATP synthase F0 subunit 6 [Falcidens halanychi]
MMMDIFSSFDNMNFTFLKMALILWTLSFWLIFTQNVNLWLFSSWSYIFLITKKIIMEQCERSFGSTFSGFSITLSTLFCGLILCNLGGMIPYVFSCSSHLLLSLCLSLTFWTSLILLGMKQTPQKMIAHLLPVGAPYYLNPFLSVVELVSMIVRPLTLAIRLAANMGAGHIVLGLLGSYLSSFLFSSWSLIFMIPIQVGYSLFEFGVGLIQAYIFSLLITLYSDDLNCY